VCDPKQECLAYLDKLLVHLDGEQRVCERTLKILAHDMRRRAIAIVLGDRVEGWELENKSNHAQELDNRVAKRKKILENLF
jgi:hypothetical protein